MGSNRSSRKFKHLGAAASALAMMVAPAGVSASAQETQTRTFDIAAQPLAEALLEYSRQSDVTVIAPTKTTRGLTSRAIAGDMAPDEALDALLGGAALERRERADGAIVLAETDVDGFFRDRSLVRVAQVLDSSGDDRDVAEEGETTSDLDTVIVTGTNIRGVENPTVPVLTFDKEDIDLSGASTVDAFLRTIPQNFASQTQLTAESGNPNSAPNVTQGTTVDLRGLGAGSTLTLLNGRRMTPAGNSNFVDVNVLPVGIIERVDVVIDGATAIYGSDAVGGAVNFITRKDYEGFDVNARYGTVTEGSMENWGVGGAGGVSWGSGGVFAGVDYQEQTPLLATERDFVDLLLPQDGTRFGSDSERFSVAGGVNQALGSSVSVGIDVFYSDTTNESNSVSSGIPRVNTSDQEALFINSRLEYDVSDRITAELFFDYGENTVSNIGADGVNPDSFNSFDNELFLYEGRISGQLFNLPGGLVSFSIGGLYREEDYEANNNDLLLSGVRNVAAGYAEVLAPIIGADNTLPFIQRLELSMAGRYEDYSDVGDSLDPKIGVYWEVNDELSLRASYSESFRAPDLQTLNGGEQWVVAPFPSSFITGFPPPEPSTLDLGFPFPDFAVVAFLTGFNPNLNPESARSWSAGFSYQPSFFDGLTVEGNFFDISYQDRIEVISFIDILSDGSLASLVNTMPIEEAQTLFARADAGEIELVTQFGETAEDIQILLNSGPQNVSERDVRGVDLNIDYSIDTKIGRFSAGANASYLIDFVQRLNESLPSVEQVNVVYRPVDFKMRANLSWSHNGFTAFTAVNYTDGYRDRIDPSIANGIDAWTTIDLSLAYDTGNRFDSVFVNGLRFGFNVTNLFDNDPPFVATPFGLNYDSANANPFNRQINLTLSKRF